MERIDISIPGRGYPAYVGRDLYEEVISDVFSRIKPGKIVIISHQSILQMHGERLHDSLNAVMKRTGKVLTFAFPEGEEGKNLRTLEEGYMFLLEAGVNREDVLLAFGGGVVGDLAGFLASSYYRGIPYIQVPTTLMSMVDSSVGGKVGVDLPGAKNAVGAFYQPMAVVCDVELLQTLPEREYRCGLAEVAKYGFLFDQDLLDELGTAVTRLPEQAMNAESMVARCVERKAGLVARDERDTTGERALLNYGHTFGHALESASSYRLLRHGEAVAVGMMMAAKASVKAGFAPLEMEKKHEVILQPLLGDINLPVKPGPARILEDMEKDKKRGERIRFVLLEDLQKPRLVDDLSGEIIAEAVEEVIKDIGRGFR